MGLVGDCAYTEPHRFELFVSRAFLKALEKRNASANVLCRFITPDSQLKIRQYN